MNSVLSMMKRDLVRSGRDNILLYIILSPLLLAVAAAFLLPKFVDTPVIIAVDGDAAAIVSSLSEVATVEITEASEIRERVTSEPETVGVVSEDDGYRIILSGSEESSTSDLINTTLIPLLNGDKKIELPESRSASTKGIVVSLLLMTTLVLGGMAVGFLIVDERSGKMMAGTAVSPVGMVEYTLSKSLFSLAVPMIIGIFVNLIVMGRYMNWTGYFLTTLAAAPLGIIFGLLTGYVADNQIAALGIIKLLMPVFLTVPVVTLFVPLSLKWIFVIFPNFWIFESLLSVYTPGYESFQPLPLMLIAGLVTGLIPLILFIPRCARRFGLR